jgi:hypothetical protein
MALNIIVSEVGANLVISGSGTLNVAALTLVSSGATVVLGTNSNPGLGIIFLDNAGETTLFDVYTGFSPSTFFGSNTAKFGDVFSGDSFGISVDDGDIYLPTGYTSSSVINGSMTINNSTLVEAGFLAGTYTYSWGSGGSADSIIINAVASVTPTPTPTVTNTSSPTPTVTNTSSPTPTPSQTGTIAATPTPTGTIAATPTNTSSPTPTPSVTMTNTPTRTASVTPTPSVTMTNTPTQTGTAAVTPSPTSSVTPTVTPTQTASPTPTITPSSFGVFYANEYYEFTDGMFGSYSGGTAPVVPPLVNVPHPINQAMIGDQRGTVQDQSAVALGGFNGLNN